MEKSNMLFNYINNSCQGRVSKGTTTKPVRKSELIEKSWNEP